LIITLFVFVLCYVGLCAWFIRELNPEGETQNLDAPSVSVIVAARNEAENLPSCLESLIALDYPKEKLQLVVVDDGSEDGTNILVSSYVEKHSNLLLLSLTEKQKEKPGKAGALIKGIKASDGEFIFITDADCRVPVTWVNSLLQTIRPDVGICGGPTIMEHINKTGNWWSNWQTCEILFLQSIAYVLAKNGRPVSWLGNNIVIRRSAYNEVGGLDNLYDTLVEDYALINTVRTKTNWKIRFSFRTGPIVKTNPVKKLSELYAQRKRWASDRKNIPLWGFAIMAVNYATHLLLLLSIIWGPLLITTLAMLAIFISNYFVLKKSNKLLQKKLSLIDFIGFELLYILTTCIFPIFFAFGQVRWKNKTYS
jgi:cellulose synthase/poly-beta-1,6-N-acetylglucosamine synthase-like glycosyltransferase